MRTHQGKITRELCDRERLIFYPECREEAEFIQHKLFEMGCAWINGGRSLLSPDDCVKAGIYLENGKMYTDMGNWAVSKDALLCTLAQFHEKGLSADQAFMLEQFNKLAARIEQVAEMVEELRAEMLPKKLEKPALKRLERGL